MQELFLLDGPRAGDLRRTLEKSARVVQEAAPRLLVVEGPAAQIEVLGAIPGVQSLGKGSVPNETLSPSEQLFVDAWQRGSETAKQRPFDGFNWGSSGLSGP